MKAFKNGCVNSQPPLCCCVSIPTTPASSLRPSLLPRVLNMATRNRTPVYRKYRDALRNVRAPSPTSLSGPSTSSSYAGRGGGPVIELVSASLLRPDRSYTPLSTEDPGGSRSDLALSYLIPSFSVSDYGFRLSYRVFRIR